MNFSVVSVYLNIKNQRLDDFVANEKTKREIQSTVTGPSLLQLLCRPADGNLRWGQRDNTVARVLPIYTTDLCAIQGTPPQIIP